MKFQLLNKLGTALFLPMLLVPCFAHANVYMCTIDGVRSYGDGCYSAPKLVVHTTSSTASILTTAANTPKIVVASISSPTINTPSTTSTTVSSPVAATQSAPPGWPWRGISVAGDATASDIAALSAMKVNAVALSLAPRIMSSALHISPEQAFINRLVWADQMLDACKKYGIVGIITISDFPIDPSMHLTQVSPEFWNDPGQQQLTVSLIDKLAEHFKNRGAELGAYDILNEPLENNTHTGEMSTPSQWSALQDAIIRKIRQSDPNRYVITTPGMGADPSAFTNFSPLNFPRIIYSFHMYRPHYFTHQGVGVNSLYWQTGNGQNMHVIYPNSNNSTDTDPVLHHTGFIKAGLAAVMQPVVDFQKKYGAYVYVGEFSAARWAQGGDLYLSDLISIFDKDKFSWIYVGYGVPHQDPSPWNPSFDNQFFDNTNPAVWMSHYVGFNTPRWFILKKAYSKNP